MFLDRDGIMNEAIVRGGRPYAPRTLDDFVILPGAADGVARLRMAGFLTVVVTNQPDVGTGLLAPEVLEAMHRRLRETIALDDVRVCTCTDGCPCYKPNPGMLLEAAVELGVDLPRSFMVGDRWRDVGAGVRAGCATVFVDYGYDEVLRDPPDHVVGTFQQAVDCILGAP